MYDCQVVISLQLEAIRSLEEKAKSIRAEMERQGDDSHSEGRLRTIERILEPSMVNYLPSVCICIRICRPNG